MTGISTHCIFFKKNHKSIVILKKMRYEEGMAFFTEECQLLNIEEMMELKNHPFWASLVA